MGHYFIFTGTGAARRKLGRSHSGVDNLRKRERKKGTGSVRFRAPLEGFKNKQRMLSRQRNPFLRPGEVEGRIHTWGREDGAPLSQSREKRKSKGTFGNGKIGKKEIQKARDHLSRGTGEGEREATMITELSIQAQKRNKSKEK